MFSYPFGPWVSTVNSPWLHVWSPFELPLASRLGHHAFVGTAPPTPGAVSSPPSRSRWDRRAELRVKDPHSTSPPLPASCAPLFPRPCRLRGRSGGGPMGHFARCWLPGWTSCAMSSKFAPPLFRALVTWSLGPCSGLSPGASSVSFRRGGSWRASKPCFLSGQIARPPL